MRIKTSEFDSYNYRNHEIFADSENGLCLIQYAPVETAADPTLRKSYSYAAYAESFLLEIPRTHPRELQRSLVVMRTSVNRYVVVYSDKFGVETAVLKSYDEIHDFSRPLWQRSLD